MGLFDGAADGDAVVHRRRRRAPRRPGGAGGRLLVAGGVGRRASCTASPRSTRAIRLAGVDPQPAGVATATRPWSAPPWRPGRRRVPVLGALHRDARLAWRDRHLGLVPVAERPDEVAASLARLAELDRRAVRPRRASLRVARSARRCARPRPAARAPTGRRRRGSPSPAARRSRSATPTTSRRSPPRAPRSCPFDPLRRRRPARRRRRPRRRRRVPRGDGRGRWPPTVALLADVAGPDRRRARGLGRVRRPAVAGPLARRPPDGSAPSRPTRP